MKVFGAVVGGVVVAVALTLCLSWVFTGNSLALYKYYGPQYQAVERSVYQESPSFLNGNRQALLNQVSIIQQTKDPDARATAIAALRLQVNGLPEGFVVPNEVREVLNQQ